MIYGVKYKNDVVYNDSVVSLIRSEVKTLEPDTYVATGVINAWSSHLNTLENYSSQDSPFRFFFTMYVYMLYVYIIYALTKYAYYELTRHIMFQRASLWSIGQTHGMHKQQKKCS